MIKNFKCPETKKIWEGKISKKLAHNMQHIALRKLIMLNNAQNLNDLNIPPANRLEPLNTNRTGQHSIRINNQWRICFLWLEGDVFNLSSM